jgi:hypothetical protein
LDEAARQGFANGALEDLAEDVPAVVEEFFAADAAQGESVVPSADKSSLLGRLEEKAARVREG